MITLYLWDENGYFVGASEVDETGPMPPRSTPTKPPKLTGTQIAQWQGAWVKLAAAPEAEPAPAPDWPALIAARRFQAETGGVTVQGIQVNTERDSQALLTGAAFAASLDPDYQIKWKATTGFVELTGEQILGVASQVRAFVQACFNREDALLGAVTDGTITADMLEEGWPA